MTSDTLPTNNADELQRLLCRPDVWRGLQQAGAPHPSVSTGYAQLDAALLHSGWPRKSLVEVCRGQASAEWQLLRTVLTNDDNRVMVLLNPPTRPFVPALIQGGIDLERLIIVEAAQKPDFMMAYLSLMRTSACAVVVAWQPKQSLSYTELRKLHLASLEADGLCFLIRPDSSLQQSSPAALRVRLDVHPNQLAVSVVKQRGMLSAEAAVVQLPIPRAWQGQFLYHELNRPVVKTPVRPKTKRGQLRSV